MSVFAAAYVSTATRPLSDRDLSELLLTARRRNAVDGITGKLYAVEQDGQMLQFVQWIEGEAELIRACLQRIRDDDRHTDLRIQFFGPTPRRRFPDWVMDIQTIAPSDLEAAVIDVTPALAAWGSTNGA